MTTIVVSKGGIKTNGPNGYIDLPEGQRYIDDSTLEFLKRDCLGSFKTITDQLPDQDTSVRITVIKKINDPKNKVVFEKGEYEVDQATVDVLSQNFSDHFTVTE